MAKIVGYDEAYARRIQRDGRRVRVPFMDSDALNPHRPYALLTRVEPGCVIDPHYHATDQWQFIAEGDAILGRAHISRYCIHFNRAYTPYGPLQAASNSTMAYFDLYPRYQPGAFHIVGPDAPQNMAALKRNKTRRPWQIKRHVTFPSQHGIIPATEVRLEAVPDISDDDGLYAYSLVLPAHGKCTAPDPSPGEGQFIVIVNGALLDQGNELESYVVIFVAPADGPFEVCAGAAGLEALILNFPRAAHNRIVWKCQSCGFIFDEAQHVPSDGQPYGHRWKDLPGNWTCPGCAAAKTKFEFSEVD